jgi:AccI restriction endonuclease
MTYLERINAIKEKLEEMESPARLDIPFKAGRPPTQAFSEFLTNKEQGDWAEKTFVENFNRTHDSLWAVKYGRSEDLIAGEPRFNVYYTSYQAELEEIGKRPDLLIFNRSFFVKKYGEIVDISNFERILLDALVNQAISAIEVRSSAFILSKYQYSANQTRQKAQQKILNISKQLLDHYEPEISTSLPWKEYLTTIVNSGISEARDPPNALSKKSSARLAEMSGLTKTVKENLKILQKRDFLSITPKAEDLSLVYKWIQKFGIEHHYCQVFFDKAIILSFENILEILGNSERENIDYFIESDEKNQGKVTFKINVQLGQEIINSVELPKHTSVMKELPRGRLLFYVRFETSSATFNTGVISHG